MWNFSVDFCNFGMLILFSQLFFGPVQEHEYPILMFLSIIDKNTRCWKFFQEFEALWIRFLYGVNSDFLFKQ